MNGQKLYDEKEVEQILSLAGARPSRSNEYALKDLENAAEEMGISPEIVQKAAQQLSAFREEQADRAEYRRLQIKKTWSLMAIFIPLILFGFFSPIRSQLPMILMYATLALISLPTGLDQRSSGYEIAFRKWRLQRIGRIAPQYLKAWIQAAINFYLVTYPGTTKAILLTYLMSNFGISAQYASEMMRVFSDEHPEFRIPDQQDREYILY